MTIEFINQQHPLYPAVRRLGRKYAATLGFMPEGGFDDYARDVRGQVSGICLN